MIEVRYEGLRELAQALRAVNTELYATLLEGLHKVGEVIRTDAAARFDAYGSGGTPAREASFARAAAGFRTLVRPNTSSMAVVSVAQTIRRTPDLRRRRSNLGDLMMRHALLPAQGERMGDAVAILDAEVAGLLRENGF